MKKELKEVDFIKKSIIDEPQNLDNIINEYLETDKKRKFNFKIF